MSITKEEQEFIRTAIRRIGARYKPEPDYMFYVMALRYPIAFVLIALILGLLL